MTPEYKFRFHKKVRESKGKGIIYCFWFFVAVMYTQYLAAIGEI